MTLLVGLQKIQKIIRDEYNGIVTNQTFDELKENIYGDDEAIVMINNL
jgi:hypothetical protein